MFDPRDPYERCYWHYDSRRPLSMARLIALGSVDAETAALVWLMIERGTSFTIAGPTDPKPGVGKTTVLNALFQFLPAEAALAYTAGMYEDFGFKDLPDIDPANTYVLCNEISDHQPFYMWGRVARRYLLLPNEGYRIATSIHADTIDDMLYMYRYELRLSAEAIRRLGLVIHIGMVETASTPLRRWVTTHWLQPEADVQHPDAIIPLPLSIWHDSDDTFTHAEQRTLDDLAAWLSMTPHDFAAALKERANYLRELAGQLGIGMDQMYEAIAAFRERQKAELALHIP